MADTDTDVGGGANEAQAANPFTRGTGATAQGDMMGHDDPPSAVPDVVELASDELAKRATAPVASNAEPTPTSGDVFAEQARDAAVEARAQQYEKNGDAEAAQRVRDKLGGDTSDSSAAAPTT